MPRVRWCCWPLMCAFIVATWIAATSAGCYYAEETHQEGVEVTTVEPCLNCTCSRGTLLCYLRVCPQLPDPPPPGCILLHRYRTCCPQLICTDFGSSNTLEARAEPDDDFNLQPFEPGSKNACVVNGSIYGPGSALDSSTDCEYCYCLGGKATCVKPKCLLPISGCIPIFDKNNCCPVHYNCTYPTSSTTTAKPQPIGGCYVDSLYYAEGGKVQGVGHSVCDNCYCLRGVLRCEPLSCAPPLLGCAPVVRAGECCAASYNCSGTIEIQPEPNYGHFPIVSKEYAKLRKEAPKPTENSNVPFYVMAESSQTTKQRSFGTFGTTRHFTGVAYKPSTVPPTTKWLQNELEGKSTKVERNDVVLNRIVKRVTNEAETTTEMVTESTTLESISTVEPSTINVDGVTDNLTVVTVRTIRNTTDCIGGEIEADSTTLQPFDVNEINKMADFSIYDEYLTTSEESSSEAQSTTFIDLTDYTIEEKEIKSATTRSTNKMVVEIEAILNATKAKNQDYEYDYNEPTLPPSLPNLRIIPFVAADAVESKMVVPNPSYESNERVSDNSFDYPSRFSPPVETEGGFVPKEPPILDSFYENAVTVPSITNTPHSNEINCLSNNKNYIHGEVVPSEAPCLLCNCFYGQVVCQNTPCPIPKLTCRKSPQQAPNACCPQYICDDEAPTVVLDQIVQETGTQTPSPFRDVIRTKLPPNLQSQAVNSAVTEPIVNVTTESNDDFSLDKVLELLFANRDVVPEAKIVNVRGETTTRVIFDTTTASTTKLETNYDSEVHPNSVDSSGLAILKLAGCNIYGRMYRVGRIISELSNPCLECKCTEIGVQCRALKC